MNDALVEHISLLAAPIYAAFLTRAVGPLELHPDTLSALRRHALDQATALWLDARDYQR